MNESTVGLTRDIDHLRLLSVFYFIFAGLSLFGLIFLGVQAAIVSAVVNNADVWKNAGQGPPPEAVVGVFKGFFAFLAVLALVGGVLNLLSGIYLRRQKNKLFSQIVAGLNCLSIPLGTILGIFTLVVLARDSVARLYADRASVP